MKFSVLTLFPDMFSPLKESIIGKAIEDKKIELNLINIRDFSKDKHKKVDDTPYGGGAGMVMKADVVYDAYEHIKDESAKVIFLSPQGKTLNQNKVKELVSILNKYQPSICLHIINFTELQEAIYKNIDPSYMITIMRRMMYRISEKVLKQRKCLVLINGESVGQVASQTLTSMQVINNVTNLPVIRPVACLDKLEIIDIAKKIGTYETSILPYEDCCTIFLPKHPVINPNLEKAIEYENTFDYQSLIEKAIDNKETVIIDKNYKKIDI